MNGKKKKRFLTAAGIIIFSAAVLTGCGEKDSKVNTESGTYKQNTQEKGTETEKNGGNGKVASPEETAAYEEVVTEDMVPIYGTSVLDGEYEIKVDSSSSMFQIVSCKLTVKEGKMTAVMTMGGTGYLYLYMGTGTEAANADDKEYISFTETQGGEHTFEIPVEALDKGIACAAFSRKKEQWYDRQLVFRADSLPAEAFEEGVIHTVLALGLEEGTYTIEAQLEGGSGKSGIESPLELRITGGEAYAKVTFHSSNYDYMLVEGERYEPINPEGNSCFEIPVAAFDRKIPVTADTTAMSTPHEIEYTITFYSDTIEKAAN